MKTLLASILILTPAYGAEVPASIREIVAIQIPKIAAQDSTLSELVDYVAHRIKELDPNKPGGISFITIRPSDADQEETGHDTTRSGEKKFSYTATDVRVDKVMMDLAKLYDVDFHVTSVGVVITPSGSKPFPNSKSDKGAVYYTYKKEGEQDAPSNR